MFSLLLVCFSVCLLLTTLLKKLWTSFVKFAGCVRLGTGTNRLDFGNDRDLDLRSFLLLFQPWQTLNRITRKVVDEFFHEIFGRGTVNNRLHFGAEPVLDPDLGARIIFSIFRNFDKIVVNVDD